MIILILSLTFALLVAVFALQNAAPVAIKFFWTATDVPLVLVILASALSGALIVFLLAIWREFRYKRKKASLTKKLQTQPNKPQTDEGVSPEEKKELDDSPSSDEKTV